MSEAVSITLRALEGEPLRDDRVRDMVVAAANGLAEREGVELLSVDADPDCVTVILRTDRIVALAFVAELRRGTDAWYRHRTGGLTLWGEPHAGEPRDDEREAWE